MAAGAATLGDVRRVRLRRRRLAALAAAVSFVEVFDLDVFRRRALAAEDLVSEVRPLRLRLAGAQQGARNKVGLPFQHHGFTPKKSFLFLLYFLLLNPNLKLIQKNMKP
uniref:Uncharacterized protein n=1 Tax=Zea mays TaxID=4577 RepID=C4J016_MAIZE|nr:unknown [Zea mays]